MQCLCELLFKNPSVKYNIIYTLQELEGGAYCPKFDKIFDAVKQSPALQELNLEYAVRNTYLIS